jgi:branched-chain amino acid transport system substrate-binding protein
MSKTVLNWALALFLITTFVAVPAQAAAPTGEPIRIAVVTEVTGQAAMSGDHAVKGVNLAKDEINAAGGVLGRPIELVVEDTQSTNPGAIAAYNKAVQQDKVVAVIAPVRSTQIQSMDQAVRDAKLVTVFGATNPTLTQKGNPWLFRFRAPDSYAGRAMVEFLVNKLNIKKIGILHDSDAFGTGGADVVEATLKDMGLQAVRREKFRTGDKDYAAQLLNIKNAGAEALVSYGTNAEDVAIYLRQRRDVAPNLTVIGSPSAVSEVAFKLGGDAIEGVYGVTDFFPEANATAKNFVANYGKAYDGALPDFFASWLYDALYALSYDITQAGGTDPEAMRQAMFTLQGKESAEGTDNCAPNGDCAHTYYVVQAKGGKQTLIDTLNFWKPAAGAAITATQTITQ